MSGRVTDANDPLAPDSQSPSGVSRGVEPSAAHGHSGPMGRLSFSVVYTVRVSARTAVACREAAQLAPGQSVVEVQVPMPGEWQQATREDDFLQGSRIASVVTALC